jgi:ankyrin repeat protein
MMQRGITSLMLACMHGRPVIVKVLMDAGADVNEQDMVSEAPSFCDVLWYL